jgi:hypothetical protein
MKRVLIEQNYEEGFVPTVPTSDLFHILYQARAREVKSSSKMSKKEIENLGTVSTVGTTRPAGPKN